MIDPLNDDILEWGICQEQCPQEAADIVCLDEPAFPKFVYAEEEADGYRNFSSPEYEFGSEKIMDELTVIPFECPDGYHFEGSTNVTQYALCHNWEWTYDFDRTAMCQREFIVLQGDPTVLLVVLQGELQGDPAVLFSSIDKGKKTWILDVMYECIFHFNQLITVKKIFMFYSNSRFLRLPVLVRQRQPARHPQLAAQRERRAARLRKDQRRAGGQGCLRNGGKHAVASRTSLQLGICRRMSL